MDTTVWILTYLSLGSVILLFLTGRLVPSSVRRVLMESKALDPDREICLRAAWDEVEQIDRRVLGDPAT